MTNQVKQSLEDNKDIILKNLPPEFHADFEASIKTAAPTPCLTHEQMVKEAEHCMRENPNILAETIREVLLGIQADKNINQAIAQPSAAELEKQKEDALAEIKAQLN